ncbi:MAG: hypothetical protein ACLFPS_09185, partial [Clostridia bacterium]
KEIEAYIILKKQLGKEIKTMKIITDYKDIEELEVDDGIKHEVRKCIKKLENHYGKTRDNINGYVAFIENENDLEFLQDAPTNFITSKDIINIDRIKTSNDEDWISMYINVNYKHDIFVVVREEWAYKLLKNV